MFNSKSLFKSLLITLTLAGATVTGVHTIAKAQGTPGLVIFGNRDVDILNYYLDFGGVAEGRDRYRLRIPQKKLPNGATRFVISYPDYFDGKFNTDKIEVRVNGKKDNSLPLKNVVWDEKNHLIQIDLAQPLLNPKKLELVFSNVKNPDVGTYYFYAKVFPAVNAPVPQQVGAWVISINP
ncbi:hypothetical protein C7B62_22370 [Pleurocapsa sp. CCALA 161]|uniref:DUF2808 domain-containing protein n=1 Tax=Pleurocapsa sp. CCALA 161 TaxID=2107688 RepID=UPI000D049A8F|nr:DUF2808 domain-containing protein [Pleurocapsa sp. CCALA 161]PSB06616.1 hypothetical protein C7B62_22370 [Pleurocapsa sp. CCALA 161]